MENDGSVHDVAKSQESSAKST